MYLHMEDYYIISHLTRFWMSDPVCNVSFVPSQDHHTLRRSAAMSRACIIHDYISFLITACLRPVYVQTKLVSKMRPASSRAPNYGSFGDMIREQLSHKHKPWVWRMDPLIVDNSFSEIVSFFIFFKQSCGCDGGIVFSFSSFTRMWRNTWVIRV